MYSLVIFSRFFFLYLTVVKARVSMVIDGKIKVEVARLSILIGAKELVSSSELLDLAELYRRFF